MVLTRTDNVNASENAKLVFERDGDRYFFAQAQLAGNSTGLAMVGHKQRGNAMANGNKKSVIVIVAE
jgi:hypothetical protein